MEQGVLPPLALARTVAQRDEPADLRDGEHVLDDEQRVHRVVDRVPRVHDVEASLVEPIAQLLPRASQRRHGRDEARVREQLPVDIGQGITATISTVRPGSRFPRSVSGPAPTSRIDISPGSRLSRSTINRSVNSAWGSRRYIKPGGMASLRVLRIWRQNRFSASRPRARLSCRGNRPTMGCSARTPTSWAPARTASSLAATRIEGDVLRENHSHGAGVAELT